MRRKSHTLTIDHIRRYADYLREQERSTATIQKYLHDLTALLSCLGDGALTKAALIKWKEELTRAEYARLVQAAEWQENQRLSLIIQTICATGIRGSELKFITVEAVQTGCAEIFNKGKRRPVFLPAKLRKLLKA